MKRLIIRIFVFIGIFNVGAIVAGPIDDLGQAIVKGDLRGFVKAAKPAIAALNAKGEMAIGELPGGLGAAADSLGQVLKGISKIRLTNIKVTPEGKKGINIAAKAKAFGKSANIDTAYDITKKGGYATIGVDAIKFSEIHSIFKVVDSVFQIKKPTFKIATVEITDRDKQKLVPYKKGLNFSANIGAGGFVEGLLRQRVEAQAEGVIANDKQLIGSEIKLKIPTKSDLGLGLTLDESALSILTRRDATTNLATVAVGLTTGLRAAIPTNPTPLDFKVQVAFDTAPTGKVSVKGEMDGTWVNAFGFPFLVLEDVGVEVAKTYASGNQPLTEFAVKSSMVIGSKTANIVVQVKAPATGKKAISVIGSLEGGLKLSDIADLASKATKGKINIDKLPDLGIDQAQVYIVTEKTALIFGKSYSRGVYIAGEATLFGKKAKMVFSIDPKQGIIAEGYMQEFSLGVLKCTGAGPDRKKNTPDDGMTIELKATRSEQGFFMSGEGELKVPFITSIVRQAIQMEITRSSVSFDMEQEFLGAFSGEMFFKAEGSVERLSGNDFTVRCTLKQTALAKIRDLFNKAAKGFKLAQEGVKKTKEALMAAKNKAFGLANQALGAAKAQYDAAIRKLDDLSRKINPSADLKRRAEAAAKGCARMGGVFS